MLQELFQELHHFHKHPADHDEGRDGAGHAAHAVDRQSDSVPVPSLRDVGYLRPRPKGPSISAACPPATDTSRTDSVPGKAELPTHFSLTLPHHCLDSRARVARGL